MAWWLRRRTTVPLRWLSERLHLGHYTRASQAVSRMNQQPGRKLEALRKRLLKLDARLNERGQAITF
jgi:hypothetical protein